MTREVDQRSFPYTVTGFKVSARQGQDNTAARRAAIRERKPKRMTYHASVVGALAQARIFRAVGCMVWIEGLEPATLLEKSRSPATSQQLANKRGGAR